MSTKVDIGKPLTCNDKPVEVLTGWVCSKKIENDKVCLVYWDGWYAPMNQEGELYCFEEEVLTASNVAPPKNLVKLGDKVNHRSSVSSVGVEVIGIDASDPSDIYLWLSHIDPKGRRERYFDPAKSYLLNGLPIEGVRE